ncbi:transglycosylase SLT domain-containing protein [Allosphingosinicella deserti]|uniref:Flagellar biosynthesis protein FlgJ n=1 Tax=Allosphingosinicella deserti TaxID=2116704 RepID=A0A2P7QNW8_9SPHN|nr:transglycosylase SLT domain-containing protein [Sphingomonas deserti]PSJ39665.1 flagellar biosynthesis protein FlgJ [Sphingomonas deserti]
MNSTAIRQSWTSGGREGVGAAIQQAAARTGVDFQYLLGQARIESGFNPNAKARTSSATGLFQFIDQTWLATVEKHGAKHGLGWAADAIRASGGRYQVADPATRRAILDLRRDPEAASAMAAEFASDNQQYLERKIGRPMESVDLYLAHFLGAGGASKFLRGHDADPDGSAASILPAAARANRAIFYRRDGSARSFAEIRERFAAKLGGTGGSLPPAPPRDTQDSITAMRMATLETPAQPVVGPSPAYARLAYLMLAELGG